MPCEANNGQIVQDAKPSEPATMVSLNSAEPKATNGILFHPRSGNVTALKPTQSNARKQNSSASPTLLGG